MFARFLRFRATAVASPLNSGTSRNFHQSRSFAALHARVESSRQRNGWHDEGEEPERRDQDRPVRRRRDFDSRKTGSTFGLRDSKSSEPELAGWEEKTVEGLQGERFFKTRQKNFGDRSGGDGFRRNSRFRSKRPGSEEFDVDAPRRAYAPAGRVRDPNEVLFVTNMPYNVEENELKTHFEKFGEITKLRLPTDDQGRPTGYGFVEFSNLSEAQAALESFQKYPLEIGGRHVRIEYSSKVVPPSQPTNVLFVGGLPTGIERDDVRAIFEDKGFREILTVRLSIDSNGGRRGFAHIDLPTPDHAAKIVEMNESDPFIYEGRQLTVAYSTPRREFQPKPYSPRIKEPTRVLFVAGFGPDVTSDDIREKFGGNDVFKLRHATDGYGRPRGFCHIEYKSTKRARMIMEEHETNPITIEGAPLKVDYADARRRREDEEPLEEEEEDVEN